MNERRSYHAARLKNISFLSETYSQNKETRVKLAT